MTSRTHTQGRRPATDHATIEQAAFTLFEQHGFDETTMEQIADAVGVGRRTLFRYFPSKNDIPWGQFEESLRHFRLSLDAVPHEVPTAEAVMRCVVSFNDFGPEAMAQHRLRMRLILSTPTLLAHSSLRYASWRGVIVDFVAARNVQSPSDLEPRTVGHVSLALALAAYEDWLEHPDGSLTETMQSTVAALRAFLD